MGIKYKDPTTGQFKDISVKVADSLPIGTEVDYDGETVPTGWEQVDNPNDYSTTETRIGTWIDGKPLYRKVLTFENKTITSNNNSSECVHNVSNLDFGIVREAYYDFNGENVWCTASNVITTSTTSYNVGYKVGSSSIYLKYISDISFSASNTRKWLFIIEYTKTTD